MTLNMESHGLGLAGHNGKFLQSLGGIYPHLQLGKLILISRSVWRCRNDFSDVYVSLIPYSIDFFKCHVTIDLMFLGVPIFAT